MDLMPVLEAMRAEMDGAAARTLAHKLLINRLIAMVVLDTNDPISTIEALEQDMAADLQALILGEDDATAMMLRSKARDEIIAACRVVHAGISEHLRQGPKRPPST
ncbi:hypothetical protein [Oceanibaculum indicum]|uniref:Uncharacterized protein n=1 Tax=Oceanibaculum indicum P24 TaxID=1207063 RepID=K2K6H8_9PROT|nr:hypothetical protein [Oceanibaculum indicum]EKE78469.1 hypothetical protein P24_02876 [Oceanibaculum indicum P24]